jgi:hypothetical protein
MKSQLARAVVIALAVLLTTSSTVLDQAIADQAAAAAAAPAAQTTAAPAKPAEESAGWDVSIYPILAYVPVMGINVRLPDAPPCTNCPPGTPPESSADSGLSGAAFFGFRVEKSRLSVEGVFNYAGLEASKDAPFVNVNLKIYAGSFKGGFMVVKDLYAEVGARYLELKVTAGVLTYPEVRWEPGRWDPQVGVTYHPRLGKRWRLQSHLDWVGLGGDAYSATSGQARLEWEPVKHFLLTAGYGFSKEKINATLETAKFGNKDIHLDYTLHGPVLGIGFNF